MSNERSQLGNTGELLAAEYLRNQGYAIIHRNYRTRKGEIDIIAKLDNTTIFIEVKTRSTAIFGSPLCAVTPKKQSQISRVALEYLCRENAVDSSARFDVVSVLISKNKNVQIEHIPNAFELSHLG